MKYMILAAVLAAILSPCAIGQIAKAPIHAPQIAGTETQSQKTEQKRSHHYSKSETLQRSNTESQEFGSTVSYGLDQVAEGLACWQRIDPQAFDTWENAVWKVAGPEIPGARGYVEELLNGANASEMRGGTLFLALSRSAMDGPLNLKSDADALMAVGMSPVADGCSAQGNGLRDELRHKLRDVLKLIGYDGTGRGLR